MSLTYATRQLNLLSFGEEAEEFEPPANETKKTKMKSTYDFMENAVPTPIELLEELKKEPEPKKVTAEKVTSIQERLKEKVRASDEKRKRVMLEEEEAVKVAATPSEERSSAIEKLKQDIRNISKVSNEEAPVQKKEKKKSLVEQEREKYATNKKSKKKSTDKLEDSDVSCYIYCYTVQTIS